MPVWWWTPVLMIGWTMSSVGFWANPDGTVYPESVVGTVKNVYVGKLTCAGRLLAMDRVQTWCYKGAVPVIVWNMVMNIVPGRVVTADFTDHATGEIDATITWLIAYVEGNPNTIAYQIGYVIDPTQAPSMLSGQF